MRNGDNRVTFECEDPILFRTQRVETLSDLRSLILSKFDGTEARKIGRVAYRLLAPMGNEVFWFRLFRLLEVGHSSGGPSVHSTYVQDDRSLAPPPAHVAVPVDEAEEDEEESDEDYVADSGDSDLSDSGHEDECVPETHVQTVARHVLPPPLPIPALSVVPSHYHSLDLDAMHERTPFLDTGEEDYNLNDSVEFRIGHKFRSGRQCFRCRQAENGCQWSLRVALRQNLRYWEVRRVGAAHSCLAPTMSQDHRQLDSSLICRVILSLIQSNPSVSIPVLQGAVQASYHFKPSYRKVWMVKQKVIAQIYGIGKSRTIRFRSCFRHCRAIFLVPFVTYASNRSKMDTSWYVTAVCSTRYFGLSRHVSRPSSIASPFSP
ncbi:hypothetical protein Ahy_B07g088476 [Arachis hypogaea]|uniref:Transposase MuDR plant domain-containing protein n=1 Tax=Arachis hypogaea TaxID=3818 RepID=A0A444YEJ5_ARAHY|nr:hypothetical protein Ahy_B07g088476 [Arachis hypogaea]